jgi:epoxyqueuosine reductase
METLVSFAQNQGLPMIVREDYELERFLRQAAFREHQRCIYCYSVRLEATARLARKSRFDAFTTTLLYSKQQKHDLVRSLAEEASRRHGIPFHYEDFRSGWRTGQEEAKALGMYRQQYCGCIYSEKERFGKTS